MKSGTVAILLISFVVGLAGAMEIKGESLAFTGSKEANPPTEVDPNISITPPTRNFGVGGGGGAIVVSGHGTWTASVSDNWITLNEMSGVAGCPVAYTVEGKNRFLMRLKIKPANLSIWLLKV